MSEKLRLNMSRIYKCGAETLFQAISEGALFKFAGVDLRNSSIDFKSGGKLELDLPKFGKVDGEFREIGRSPSGSGKANI